MWKRWLAFCIVLWPHPGLAQGDYTVRSVVPAAGYTIGSVAKQQVVIEVPRGFRLDTGSLPEKGQVDAVELREVHWRSQEAGARTRYTLTLWWQIFVAADNTRVYPLKSLNLQFLREGKLLTVPVAPGKVIVASLLPAKMDKASVQPFPDVLPPAMSLRPAWFAMGGSLFGLLLAGLYFGYGYGWLFARRFPLHFRAAAREIRGMRRRKEEARAAMQRLSRAYDDFAGYAVSHEQLGTLFSMHPQMEPLAEETRAFYQDLQQVFFAGAQPAHDLKAIERLACRLSNREMA